MSKIRASELRDPTHRNRKITVKGITGAFQGFSQPAALALRSDGTSVSVPGPRHIAVIDGAGKTHNLEFKDNDWIELID